MRSLTAVFSLGLLIAALSALDVDDLKKKANEKTDAVIADSTRKREQILRRFQEFRTDLEKLKPGLNLSLPVDARDAGKMRIIDHNTMPGMPEFRRVYAVVLKDTTLKSWHSASDSQNLDKVRAGERVEVVMVFNFRRVDAEGLAWALIRTAGGSEGYMPQENLDNAPEDVKPQTTAKKEKKYVFASDGLRMRSEPSTAGEFLVLVPYNTELMVTAYSKNKDTIDARTDYWAKVDYAGHSGWVFNAYLRAVGEKPAIEPGKVSPGGFSMPVQGKLSDKFGPRIDPITKKAGTMHRGIDIAAPKGTPIKAAKTGTVYENSKNSYWGNFIVVDHGQQVYTLYCHQSNATAQKGAKVSAGDVIGYVGRTGRATGPHLHFEVWIGGYQKIQNPLDYLPQ